MSLEAFKAVAASLETREEAILLIASINALVEGSGAVSWVVSLCNFIFEIRAACPTAQAEDTIKKVLTAAVNDPIPSEWLTNG